jgi:TRAP-type C4-dicarboxylate transport system permease small subunit
MRRLLDRLYRGAGVTAAGAIFLIFALVALQVSARLLDAGLRLVGVAPIGFIVPSIAEICGFLLSAASFLALAYTLTAGGHIRVGILVERLGPSSRRMVEAAVGLAACAVAAYATVALARLTWKSFVFNDVSYGIVPVPLALPQALMALGLAILAVAVLDVTVRAWREQTFLQSGPEA